MNQAEVGQSVGGQRAKLRLCCQTLPIGDQKTWSLVGYRYVEAFIQAEIPIRILSITGTDLTDKQSEWYTVRELFQTPVPDTFKVNVVCGTFPDLRKYYTDQIATNVAIAAPIPKPPTDEDIEMMREKYAKVFVPSWELLNKFDAKVVNRCKLYCLPPHPERVEELLG